MKPTAKVYSDMRAVCQVTKHLRDTHQLTARMISDYMTMMHDDAVIHAPHNPFAVIRNFTPIELRDAIARHHLSIT